jgi:lipoprotein-anchoring transpeptidase ErfK/SrfK
MNKSWIISLIVIIFSILAVRAINPTNRFEVQSDFDQTEQTAFFNGSTTNIPNLLANAPLPTKVLGDTTTEKTIYVDLTNQKLYAYEGDRMVYEFLVSTGKWGRTPTGTFQIANKFRYIKMSGGSRALGTYYYLPNVPFTMFYGNKEIPASRGFSIHGAYWHDNFGQPMSHGCVNMKISEAEVIYNWANPVLPEGKNSIVSTPENPGTTIIVYGVAPKS